MILRGRKIRSDAVVQECERFKTEIVSRDSFAAGCTATVPYQTFPKPLYRVALEPNLQGRQQERYPLLSSRSVE